MQLPHLTSRRQDGQDGCLASLPAAGATGQLQPMLCILVQYYQAASKIMTTAELYIKCEKGLWRTLLITKPYPPSTPAASRPTCRPPDRAEYRILVVMNRAVFALTDVIVLCPTSRAHINATGRLGRRLG